jgi:hypothetical protein
MTRKLVFLATVLVLVVVGTVWYLTRPRPGPTMENFQRLSLQMSFADVESILGPDHLIKGGKWYEWHEWHGREVRILLTFLDDGSLHSGAAYADDGTIHVIGNSPTFLDRIKALVGL